MSRKPRKARNASSTAAAGLEPSVAPSVPERCDERRQRSERVPLLLCERELMASDDDVFKRVEREVVATLKKERRIVKRQTAAVARALAKARAAELFGV